jgi:hypothetical protein
MSLFGSSATTGAGCRPAAGQKGDAREVTSPLKVLALQGELCFA